VPPVRAVVPTLPKTVDTAIRRAMSIDPGKRPGTAGAFAEAVRDALQAADQAPARPVPEVRETGLFTRAGRAARAGSPVQARSRPSLRRGVAVVAAVAALGGAVPAVLGLAAQGAVQPPFVHHDGAWTPRPFAIGAPVLDAAAGRDGMWSVTADGAATWVGFDSGAARAKRDVPPDAAHVATGGAGTWFIGPNEPLTDSNGRALGATGADVAVGDSRIWVLSADGRWVSRIRPDDGSVEATTAVPAAKAIATDGKSAWVVDGVGNVMPVGEGTARATGLGSGEDLAVGGGAVWVLDRAAGTVARVDLEDGAHRIARRDLGTDVRAIAFSRGVLWIVRDDGRAAPLAT
jgi:hypothetical protein